MIIKHFEVQGATDPITRMKIDPTVIIDNHELRKACESFLDLNPWAYQFEHNEDYNSIVM